VRVTPRSRGAWARKRRCCCSKTAIGAGRQFASRSRRADAAALMEIGQVLLSRDEVATVIETLRPVASRARPGTPRAAGHADNTALYVPLEGTGGALRSVLVLFTAGPA
jgi:hypothetical protein